LENRFNRLIILTLVVCLILGTAPAVLGKSTSGPYFSFESHNYPGDFIRHMNGLGEKSTISATSSLLDMQDSTFALRQGFIGTDYVAFESLNYPGEFLRHQNGRLIKSKETSDNLFKMDSSFKIVPGLADSHAVSFKSYNYPGNYIRHRNGHLYVEKNDGTSLFKEDATWRIVTPWASS